MRGYLVDPFGKTVEEVETSGYPHFKEIIDVDIITAVTVAVYDGSNVGRDTVWVDDEGLLEDIQAFFQVEGYHQPLAGRGILLGTDPQGETVSAYMSLEEFKKMVTFPDIELDHMEMIPEGATTTLLGKEVPMVGSYPIFRQKSETTSDE